MKDRGPEFYTKVIQAAALNFADSRGLVDVDEVELCLAFWLITHSECCGDSPAVVAERLLTVIGEHDPRIKLDS